MTSSDSLQGPPNLDGTHDPFPGGIGGWQSPLHAGTLDDVGTKVTMERLTLPPMCLLETSPGNYQAGYIPLEPLCDELVTDRLMNAIVTAGLCDPEANGPRARLVRLPVAVNAKLDPPFRCRMLGWSRDLRYSV